MAVARTKDLPDVKLCHTLSTIQTKNLHYVNDAVIQVTGYLKPLPLRVYIATCSQLVPNKHMINKQHKMYPALRGMCVPVI